MPQETTQAVALPLDAEELANIRQLARSAGHLALQKPCLLLDKPVIARLCAIVLAQDARIRELEAGVQAFVDAVEQVAT